ncbi:MAG: bifunctional pyr operon transcriptional regulator/uracil phosphoribosyltransferase PyrR [Oscillospiraceae bacterium]|nr:bifunctional pyr operon transcriptional regulator/uracil phosphoribosyltransferase PyrR [Oscillospiraceae bacterium]
MEKTMLLNSESAKRLVTRMAYEIIEDNKGSDNLVMIGIQSRGVLFAKALQNKIKELEGVEIPLGSIDITFYRDDLTRLMDHPVVRETDVPFTIEDKNIILVDDILFSGRTVHSAIKSLFDMGRPAKIKLAVLVDRGHHELPVAADYCGKDVPTSLNEYIDADITEGGTINKVTIRGKEENKG